jgi:signal transduction histidine kinase
VDKDPSTAGPFLDHVGEALAEASAELRELARGIHPALLTERGLAPAITALASRAPVPVEVVALPEERLSPATEATAYFTVAEALTNVAKYANASHASVRLARENGELEIEVRDDGKGGAAAAPGSGLSGLADRLGALDGSLEIESPPGAGTVVRAVLPL